MKITMKYISIIILVFGLLQSCEVLDIEPNDKIPGEEAITDLTGLQAAVSGAYDQLQSVGFAEDAIIFGDLAADNWIHVGSKKEYREVDNHEILPSNAYVEGIWASCYDGINRVNNVLAQLPDLKGIPQETIDEHKGELLFIRALNYFTLVKFFDGVPLRVTPTESASEEELNKPRATAEDTYALIIEDLMMAEGLLPETSNPSFAGKFAAKAMLARVYLYYSKIEPHWQEAEQYARDVIENGGYELTAGDEFATLYDEESVASEIIFQVDFYNDDDQNAIADWVRHDGRLEVEAWETKARENSIYFEYDAADYRRDATLYENGGSYYCNKYTDTGNGKDNVILFRLADMYLILAEALNEQGYVVDGEAFQYLNEIRQRANVPIYYSFDLPSQEDFREAVILERRLEFAFEGHRFFDLRRTGLIAPVLGDGSSLETNDWLFPIPQSEIDTNEEMVQNGNY